MSTCSDKLAKTSTVDRLLELFRIHDVDGSGTVARKALKRLLYALDNSLTNADVELVLAAAGAADQDQIGYGALLVWLFEEPDHVNGLAPNGGSQPIVPDFQQQADVTGFLFVHGAGDCDQLGLGEACHERAKPTLVRKLLGVRVRSVACGGLHTICATAEGQLYSWGCGDDGALGRSQSGIDAEPGLVELPQGIVARRVECGDSHSCALDALGQIWLWGSYKDSTGYIGIPREGSIAQKSFEPQCVSAVKGCIDVASGANHTVALTNEGRVFSWGSNQVGQLGLGSAIGCDFTEEEPQSEAPVPRLGNSGVIMQRPADAQTLGASSSDVGDILPTVSGGAVAAAAGNREISMLEKQSLLWPQEIHHEAVEGVFASSECSFVLTTDGSAYGCGLNFDGQVGVGYANTVILQLTELVVIRGASWIGGGRHSSAALVDGRVLTWGRAEECGHGFEAGSSALLRPCPIAPLPTIRKLSCGMSHMLACSQNGEVFAWGCGITHQLGNRPRAFDNPVDAADEPDDELRPYCISSKHLHNRCVLEAAGGAQHSVELVWDGGEPHSWDALFDDEDGAQDYNPATGDTNPCSDDFGEAASEQEVVVVKTRLEFWRVQIEAVYRRRNPYKLDKVPELMEKYEGREAVLYAKVCRKYDLNPSKFYADPQAWESEDQDVMDSEGDACSSSQTFGAGEPAKHACISSLFGGFADHTSGLNLADVQERGGSGGSVCATPGNLFVFGASNESRNLDQSDDEGDLRSAEVGPARGRAKKKQAKVIKDSSMKRNRKRRHDP